MTRERIFGTDTPYGTWLRENPDLDSHTQSLAACDVDMMLHKFRDNVDGVGERRVALMMNVEVKTYDSKPSRSQLQTLYFQHQLLNKRTRLVDVGGLDKISVWHFGFFVLSLSGDRPDTSDTIKWVKFGDAGRRLARVIQYPELVKILRFQLHPETLEPLSLRRHHKTSEIRMTERTALGFEVERILKRRS